MVNTNKTKWYALFSQTGSEIKELSQKINRRPDIILTNNMSPRSWTSGISNVSNIFRVGEHKALMDLLRDSPKDTLITLHGYLRIIPKDLCESHYIMNGHPGAIHLYDELKGRDPQERITDKMEHIGSVVHRVTAEVDEGEVITSHTKVNNTKDYYNVLKSTSLAAWRYYFERYQT